MAKRIYVNGFFYLRLFLFYNFFLFLYSKAEALFYILLYYIILFSIFRLLLNLVLIYSNSDSIPPST